MAYGVWYLTVSFSYYMTNQKPISILRFEGFSGQAMQGVQRTKECQDAHSNARWKVDNHRGLGGQRKLYAFRLPKLENYPFNNSGEDDFGRPIIDTGMQRYRRKNLTSPFSMTTKHSVMSKAVLKTTIFESELSMTYQGFMPFYLLLSMGSAGCE